MLPGHVHRAVCAIRLTVSRDYGETRFPHPPRPREGLEGRSSQAGVWGNRVSPYSIQWYVHPVGVRRSSSEKRGETGFPHTPPREGLGRRRPRPDAGRSPRALSHTKARMRRAHTPQDCSRRAVGRQRKVVAIVTRATRSNISMSATRSQVPARRQPAGSRRRRPSNSSQRVGTIAQNM